ncbi:MAG: DNA replication/repair protein RecF [Leptospiraceae bacterium]|nr:DNA replication/repair protein RecF [Leptospiraceae bacterium]
MQLDRLRLQNFRSYAALDLRFNNGTVFITGDNANGKTSILEAIGMLSIGKSFRGTSDSSLTRFQSGDSWFVSGEYTLENQLYKLDVAYQKGHAKRFKVNGKSLSGRQDLIGRLISVIMSPDDLALVNGGPLTRRRFVDLLLSHQSKSYLNALMQYSRIVKQRNQILKQARKDRMQPRNLEYFDKQFISTAENLIAYRVEFLKKFGPILQNKIQAISSQQDQVVCRWDYADEREAESFSESVHKNLNRDVHSGYTTIGPHRHNLLFILNGNNIDEHGSQGQKRSLVLAMRMAEYYFLHMVTGIKPVLLVDDVIRELDQQRRTVFIDMLYDSNQAFFTSPDLDGIQWQSGRQRQVLQVRKEHEISQVHGND